MVKVLHFHCRGSSIPGQELKILHAAPYVTKKSYYENGFFPVATHSPIHLSTYHDPAVIQPTSIHPSIHAPFPCHITILPCPFHLPLSPSITCSLPTNLSRSLVPVTWAWTCSPVGSEQITPAGTVVCFSLVPIRVIQIQ